MKKNKTILRLLLIIAVFAVAGGALNSDALAQPSTYYVDYGAGSDANNGLSTNAPWQRHPYMTGFAGTYTHHSGDQFIFRGGVTWPGSCFPLIMQNGGSSSAQDYYGTNVAWHAGASWSSPIFNDTNFPIDSMTGDALIQTGSLNAYVTMDSFQITNLNWATTTGGYAIYMGYGSRAGIVITNCQFGNPYVVASGSDAFQTIYGYSGGGVGKVTHCTFTGLPSNVGCAYATYQVDVIEYSTVDHLANGFVGANSVCQYNVVQSITQSINYPTVHGNAMEVWPMSGNGYIHHNTICNVLTPAEIFDTAPLPGYTLYIYDNLTYGNTSGQQSLVLDPGSGGPSGGTVVVWNNTFQDPGHLGYIRVVKRTPAISTIQVSNNFSITESGSGVVVADGGVTSTITQGNNLQIDNATATADGYTAANLYQPASPTCPTIGAGVNLYNFMTAGVGVPAVDFLGNLFPATGAWDIGAYQLPPLGIITGGGTGIITGGGGGIIVGR